MPHLRESSRSKLSQTHVLSVLPNLSKIAGTLVAGITLLATACGGGPAKPPAPPPTPGPLASLLVASSDLGVGPQRFTLALFDASQRPITDASVHLRFFKVTSQDQAELRSEADAVFRGQGLEAAGLQDRGVYSARVTFDTPGAWGVEAITQRPGHASESTRVGFAVPAKSQTPGVGDLVPASKNKTIKDVASVEELTSARPPDPDLYRLSIADAIAQGKPLLVVFATPAFCTSKTCGPEVEVVQQLRAKYVSRMNFIHIEIYDNPVALLKGSNDRSLRPAVQEWNLPTDPWTFLVDGRGRMFDKFEGFAPASELEDSILRLLGSN